MHHFPPCYLVRLLCVVALSASVRTAMVTARQSAFLDATSRQRTCIDNASNPDRNGVPACSELVADLFRTCSQPAVNCNGTTTDHNENTTAIQASATAAQ